MEDYTNKRYGRLVGVRYTGKKDKWRSLVWEWKCDCGSIIEMPANNIKKGLTKSCGCLRVENSIKMLTTHGGTGTYEYGVWKGGRQRVLNPNTEKYSTYSRLGADADILGDFAAFLKEIGYAPKDGKKWTIDRIDNKVGYMKGNIRWALNEDQARNKSMGKDNKTGKVGVRYVEDKRGFGRYTAFWTTLVGNICTKSFAINKYGEEFAFFAACEYRDNQIEILKLSGIHYGVNHGEKYDFIN